MIAGRLGLFLAGAAGLRDSNISAGRGIAITAAFIGGRATLPGTFLGSLLLNLWVGYDVHQQLDAVGIAVAVAIAAGSTAQASGVGGWGLRRLITYPNALDTGSDLARFFAIAPVLCVTSATLSLSAMVALGAIAASQCWTSWVTWWIGDTLGVLLFLPIVMVIAGEPRAFWRSRSLSVALPMMLFFALFVAIFVRVRAWENTLDHCSHSGCCRSRSSISCRRGAARRKRFSNNCGRLSLARRGCPGAISRRWMQDPLQQLSGVQAIEWAPHVDAAQRDDFEVAQRRDVADFEIRDLDASGRLVRALAIGPDFYPLTYLEPLPVNLSALGFDVASEPVRRTAVLGTLASGGVTGSAPIRLLQQPSDQTGMLLTLAVPQGPNGPGIVLIALRLGPLIDALLGSAKQEIDLQFVDQATGRALFDDLASSPLHVQTIRFGARIYSIRTAPTAAYFTQHQSWQSWVVLMIGVLSTSLLGALLMLSTGEHQRFTRLLAERTRERDRIWQVSEDLLGVSNSGRLLLPSVNPAWTRTLGWSEDEIKTLHVDELRHPDDAPIGREGRRRLAEGVPTVRMENRFRHKDGSYRWIYWTMTAEQGLIYMIGRDVTADKEAAQAHLRTEEQLRQLQKMDSVGQLTGGIAHDFNNLLTIVIGNLEILGHQLGSASVRAQRAVTAAMSGATRAATLTQRLLAFAQKQPLRPRAVDLNELATGMAELIRRTQGETFHYEFALGANLPLCFCDANQLETALLNLAINARDAMPDGGRLKIETANTVFDSDAAQLRGIAAGTYLVLAVTDTGVGMPPETVARAFEPFFTTKGIGKGTGLGLSMVYGFVKQSNGHVEIDSAPGRGTTVRIFLPRMAAGEVRDAPDLDALAARPTDAPGSNETILLVEDDADVRGYVAETLRGLNYRVIEAHDATEALAVVMQPDMRVDLLLTDVVMPGVNGRELANRARAFLARTCASCS